MPLPKDDKSKFLARIGYTLNNWQLLESDIREQILTQPAVLVETNQYGEKYAIRATLTGRNGLSLNVLTIWMVRDRLTYFVTLVPDR